MHASTGRSRLPRCMIVPLPAAASRSLPAVASHAIGFAEPRPSSDSPGIGAYRGGREGSRTPLESPGDHPWPLPSCRDGGSPAGRARCGRGQLR
jgi:hypothetical protein